MLTIPGPDKLLTKSEMNLGKKVSYSEKFPVKKQATNGKENVEQQGASK